MTGGPLKDNYILQQIHFHWSQSDNNGSEHTVDGRHFSVEVCFNDEDFTVSI
jgi:carbonic anhydrase